MKVLLNSHEETNVEIEATPKLIARLARLLETSPEHIQATFDAGTGVKTVARLYEPIGVEYDADKAMCAASLNRSGMIGGEA